MSNTNPTPTTNILVLDANQRAALAVVRSLGKDNNCVFSADDTPEALAGHSRYSRAYHQHPSIQTQPEQFLHWLKKTVEKLRIEILVPVTEISSQLILMNIDQFSHCQVPYADLETVKALANKRNLVELAQRVNVPVPHTTPLSRGVQALDLDLQTFPVVLKPELSRIWRGDGWMDTAVHIVHSAEQLRQAIERHEYLRDFPIMVQEFIPGSGAGVFTVFNRGTPLAYFSHRRLREKPPSGGVSVLSSSAELNDQLVEYSQKILELVNWHGVAMIEFRISDQGKPYLMEVNTRFWGSLQLAIDAGVDFPTLLVRATQNRLTDDDIPHTYAIGVKLRWLLGDLDRLYLVLKNPNTPIAIKLREIARFLTPTSHTRHEVNRLDDLRPALFEMKQYVKALVGN